MESQEQQKVEGTRGASERPRERKRGGGSTGLFVGIATVVVVGVAGKLLQRFNSINRSIKATAAVAKESIADEGQQSSAAVLKNVLSVIGDHGTQIVDGDSVDAEEKYIGCDTPVAVEEKSRPRSFDADADICDHDSFSENSDSKGSAEIQVKHTLGQDVVAVDHDYHEAESPPPPCQKLETDQPAQTPFDEATLRKAKDLQEVISRALVDFGHGELSGQQLAAPKKLKLQFVWGDKPGPDALEISGSGPRSETPVPCDIDAQDDSEGSTYQSEVESDSNLSNVVSEVMDAHDTYTTATEDELDQKFSYAENHVEDTRMNSEVSGSESTDWPRAITFTEFINSVQATTSAESNDQVTVDDSPAWTDSVAESGSSVVSTSDEDLPQTDYHYCACQDSSVVHDDADGEAEFSLEESEPIYDEAESVLRECETFPSPESQEGAQHISIDDQIAHVAATERQLDETDSRSPGISKETEPAVGESLSSSEPEATKPSAYVDERAEDVDRTTVRTKEEESAKYTSEEKDAPQQQVTDGSSGLVSSVVGLEELSLRNAQADLGQNENEDDTRKAKSSVELLSKLCNPNNTSQHSVGGGSSAKIAESAILTTASPVVCNWGSLKHLEVLRMALLIALIAAIIFMIREHHLKPLKHAA